MRTGIFGGTYNPIHLAHLRIAEEVREACRLDRVLFLPAPLPPHKLQKRTTPFRHRLAMVEAAVADHPKFFACDLESHRAGASYSVDTLEALQRLYPEDDLYFIIGLDSFSTSRVGKTIPGCLNSPTSWSPTVLTTVMTTRANDFPLHLPTSSVTISKLLIYVISAERN